MRYRHVVVVAGLLVLGAATTAAAAEQAASGSVQFVEEGQLRLTRGDGLTVMVLNRHTDRAVKVSVHVLRLPASLVAIEPAQQTAMANSTASFKLSATSDEAGEGVLVAVGDDGTLARIPLIVGLPLPPSVRFTGIDRVPLLSGGDRVEPVTLHGLASSKELRTLGYVTDPRSTPAAVQRVGDELLVAGLLRSGVYRGTVDLTPGVGGGERPVMLTVRDWFPYPLAVLALVVVLIIALDRDGRRMGARYLLERHLDRLVARARQLQQEERKLVQEVVSDQDRNGHRIARYRRRDPALLLDVERDLVIESLYANDRSWDDRLGDARDSVAIICGHVEQFSGIKHDVKAMHESFKVLRERYGEQLRESPIVTQAMAILQDADVETREGLAGLAANVAEARGDLQRLLAASRLVDEAITAARMRPEHSELLKEAALVAEALPKVAAGKLPGLDEKIASLRTALDLSPATPAPSRERRPSDKVPAGAPHPDPLRGSGRWLTLTVGAALAVTSGMALLYGPNPTFGSALDYVGVVIWGIATAGGLLIARRFLPI
jgi:hypothetical protein